MAKPPIVMPPRCILDQNGQEENEPLASLLNCLLFSDQTIHGVCPSSCTLEELEDFIFSFENDTGFCSRIKMCVCVCVCVCV